MKRQKFRNFFKGTSSSESTIPGKHREGNSPSTQASVPPEQASSSTPDPSEDASSATEQTSHLGPKLPLITKSSSSAAVQPETDYVPSPPQITPPQQQDVPSLWARAYEALKDENEKLIGEYEILLSKELEDGSKSAK